jgi:dynein heavy chain
MAKIEANENYKFLQTLERHFYDLQDDSKDLPEISEVFTPIMHTILLIWTYSNYYNTPARLLVLIREICNAIINQCHKAVDGEQIFELIKNEAPGEAHQKLVAALDTCAAFKDAYFEYKGKSQNAWKITSNALFVRLDSYQERCQDVMQLTSTIQQFSKLDKIEIGNTKGKTMSASIRTILEEFKQATAEFLSVEYDIMDIENRAFDDDFFKFRQRIKELERRLASVLSQSFDDSDTIIGKFKLLESFEGLLSRAIIQDELEKKQINLLDLYKDDLKTVAQIFQDGKVLIEKQDENGPISLNMPPIAGAINWTSGLYERIREPMQKLQGLSQSIQDREEYKDI